MCLLWSVHPEGMTSSFGVFHGVWESRTLYITKNYKIYAVLITA